MVFDAFTERHSIIRHAKCSVASLGEVAFISGSRRGIEQDGLSEVAAQIMEGEIHSYRTRLPINDELRRQS